MEADGIAVLRESGSSKCRLPRGSTEAILINTSGGLAGGDRLAVTASVGQGARLTLTSQAAERVYRTLGPAAEVSTSLSAAPGACLLWLPQETILYDGAALQRRYDVALADDAEFLAMEAVILGRTEMGEVVQDVQVQDQWRISRGGKLVHADATGFSGMPPMGPAALAGSRAYASVLMVSDRAERMVDSLNQVLGAQGAASAWNGKLVARVLARDGHHLRKLVIPMLAAIVGPTALPKPWTF
jgi:urease accessory protein